MKTDIEVHDPPILIAANQALHALRIVLAVLIGLALAFGLPDAARSIIETLGPQTADSLASAVAWIFASPAAATVLVGVLVQCALSLRAGTISPTKAVAVMAVGLIAVALVGAASLAAYSGLFADVISPTTFASTAFVSATALTLATLQTLRVR